MAEKEAVVFVLDSSPSMRTTYPSTALATTETTSSPTGTRLSCAKNALEGMLSDLMIRSKTNEAGVVVLKTSETRHFMEVLDADDSELPYTNVTELTEGGVNRPNIDLLRAVRRVEPTLSQDEVNTVGGDLVTGIIVAADALYRRTHGKKFKRRLVIFTDAQHEVRIDANEMLHVMDGLRDMECTLTVIGLDFDESAEFDHPATTSLSQKIEAAGEDEALDGEGNNDEEEQSDIEQQDIDARDENDDQDEDDDGKTTLSDKCEIEKLLIRLARLTGGSVIAASTMQQVLDSTLGKRIPKSTRRKFELRITPDLVVEARFSLLLSKSNIPSLKKVAVLLDEDEKPMVNGIGEEMTGQVTTITDHWDPENTMVHVGLADITQGYRYGADCVPLGSIDTYGLKNHSPCCIEIIGYTETDNVPMIFMIGPPYVLSGADSQRACIAISSLAQALHRLKRVALCTFVKTKDADKILGALLPIEEQDSVAPSRLFFIQLPFANDVQKIQMPPLDEFVDNGEQAKVCDDMIDSLMLPDEVLRSDQIANPAIRSFHKTVVSRAIDPSSQVSTTREDHSKDPMTTPAPILEKSKGFLDAFRKAFPLEKEDGEGGKAKKRAKFWSDA